MRRIQVAVGLAVLIALGSPVVAQAALLWTLVASPLTVSTGSSTNFSLTATTLDVLSPIRCIEVEVPRNFDVEGSGAAAGWTTSIAGSSGNRVRVSSATGIGGLLNPLSTTFSIRARALSVGQLEWPANAFSRQDCGGSGSLLSVPPLVLVTGPTLTPTPVPTPAPTPTVAPTAAPTPTPTPVLPSLPLPLPSLPLPLASIDTQPTPPPIPGATPRSTPRPTSTPAVNGQDPSRSQAPGATPAATPLGAQGSSEEGSTAIPSPSNADGFPAAVPTISGAGPVNGNPAEAPPRVGFEADEVELGLGTLGLMEVAIVWIVPAATIAGPGLLLLIVVALQTTGALAWVPAVRRLRGDDEPIPA